mmetsp:Transcript_42418/g.98249  ORF Transcript_42418/g.98249 Transcript_42418/m.98249 type:complete len:704 (+) Transcript_42418:70-2181(+)
MGNSPSTADLGRWEEPDGQEAAHNVSPVLRSVLAKPGPPPMVTTNGATTLWEMASNAFEAFATRPAVGQRALLKRDMVDGGGGKQFEKLSFSDTFAWLTYREYGDRVAKLAAGLVNFAGLKKGDRVLIFAETQSDWIAATLACFRQGACIVTAYATLGEEGVESALYQTDATICFCDAKLFKVLSNVAEKSKLALSLKYVVPIVTQADTQTSEEMAAKLPKQSVKSVEELIKEGASVSADPPKPEDVAVIMYTSGTTGKSKGVIITHANLVAQSVGGLTVFDFINCNTVYIAYLPLAHIMELFIELTLLSVGAKIGYGSPHTLTDTGVKLAEGQKGDAPLLAPTLMVFAPAVLDKVYAGVKRKIAGGVKETLFNSALSTGYSRYDAGSVGCGVWDPLMVLSVQKLVGGKVKHMITGSAPLSPEIQKFVQCVFNCPVRQGYGLTETCAASSVGDIGDNTPAQVGPPTPATYIRLRDWPEGGYMNSDLDKEGIKMRRGEVLIGGPTVAQGYWIDQKDVDADVAKKNEEDFTTINGIRYFCTGDVGQVTSRGCLMIIDRKKDLFKGENGEYVSLSKVESLLKLSPYVEMPMVYGKTGAKSVIALISPQKPAVMQFAETKGLTGDLPELCKHKDVIAEVASSCLKQCKSGGLNAFEIPSAIALVCASDGTPAWTPDNDMLTSTLKLKRPIIAKAFAADIDDCYSRSK